MRPSLLPAFLLGSLVAVTACTSLVGCSSEGIDQYDDRSDDAIVKGSTKPDAVIDVPFYFAMPKTSLAPLTMEMRQKYSFATVWNHVREAGIDDLGLRLLVVPEGAGGPGSAGRRNVRQQMAKELARAGVLQDGDVVLSFRPYLADTMAYPHIQMGATHAGLTFTDGDIAHNVDQPLDGEYNSIAGTGASTRFVGSFDSTHYTGSATDEGADALHILRPRFMTPERKQHLREWIGLLGGSHQQIRAAGGLNFNSDYLKPLLAKYGTPGKVATKLGKIILGVDAPPQDFDMFCSELAYNLLALSNCTTDEIRSAGDEAQCASDAPFQPMPILGSADYTGLADGPLLDLMSAKLGAEQSAPLLESIFADNGGAKLSSGHRAVAQAVAPLMAGTKQYYQARLAGAPQAMQIATAVNAQAGNVKNYSPTAFLVNAMLPADHGLRRFDYMATVVFADAATVAKAKQLSHNPVP